ncbi:MAG TPA: metallophosphoesterase family protein [candidate division Zixibacteria bacterium]|nr:metallophosphoesterase family protein [candidate division Zixibacteria bacterium]
MRLLVLSDIHSNLEALEACLTAAPDCEAVANLGDIVGYAASPNEVVERSRSLGKIFVRGNHDRACSAPEDPVGFNPIAARAVRWTRDHLSPDNIAWLRALPAGPVRETSIPEVEFVHGSPKDEDEYLLREYAAEQAFQYIRTSITFYGHTHIQEAYAKRNGSLHHLQPVRSANGPSQVSRIALEPGSRYLINPGSVGQPRDRDPRAAFAVYDNDDQSVSFYRVRYDVELAQERIVTAGLPAQLAMRLAEGR